ncbi:MAG: hypothetical protein KIT83_21440 [Bryobacterales bacterium]|nr:hypothetical protein [Bryobacterales bacterium]
MQELSKEVQETLGRLAAAGFELLPMLDVGTHYIVGRDGLIALVQRHEDGNFGSSGNPGKLCERGLATFVRRGTAGAFVAKGMEITATADECAAVGAFAEDLRIALAGNGE